MREAQRVERFANKRRVEMLIIGFALLTASCSFSGDTRRNTSVPRPQMVVAHAQR